MPPLNHVVEGTGPAVLLLHAGVADLRMWDAQVRELSRDHLTVRCDLNGFGGSPLEPGSSPCDAEDVLALLDHLGIRHFSLVAASYGGHVGLQVATAATSRVSQMVLVAPLAELLEPDDELRAVWAEEERLLDAGDPQSATDLDVRTWLGPEAGDDMRDLLRVMQHDALVQQVAAGEVEERELPVVLERLTMPTTVVTGLRDLAFFVDTARALAHRLPRARLVELAWAAHLPSLERPEETSRLVRRALSAG
jgi:pimeloyl-ACP methyl ester carboxylesterase